MKAAEMRDLSEADLEQRMEESRKELFELKSKSRLGQVKNTARVRSLRRDIARALTLLSQRRRSGKP